MRAKSTIHHPGVIELEHPILTMLTNVYDIFRLLMYGSINLGIIRINSKFQHTRQLCNYLPTLTVFQIAFFIDQSEFFSKH